MTDRMVQDLARDMGRTGADWEIVKNWVAGRAFTAPEVWAVRTLLKDGGAAVNAASERIKAGSTAPEDAIAYAEAKARLKMILETVSGAGAEGGRTLRAFRNMKRDIAEADQILREATGKTLFQTQQEARLAAEMDAPWKMSKFVNDSYNKNFWSMVLEYWINGLISGPTTHITYSIGNTLLALNKIGPETAAAATVGAVRRAMGREGDVVQFGEVAAGLRAMRRAAAPAVTGAIEAARTGVTTALPGEEIQNVLPFQQGSELATAATTNEAATMADAKAAAFGVIRGIRDGFIGGGALAPPVSLRRSNLGTIPDIQFRGVTLPVGTMARLPSRGVAAIHSYFRIMNYSIDKAQMAYRIAANEGLEGTALEQRIGDLMQNPTGAMMEAAHGRANELTLMGQGGAFTRKLSELTNTPIGGVPIFKFIDPFVKISSNVIEQSLAKRTPLGLLSLLGSESELARDLRGMNGNVAQDMAVGRMLVGSAYLIAIGGLAAEGYITGSGPKDPQQAALWRQAGYQAHSVRIGDTWVDMHRLGPLGMLMGMAADLYDVAHKASEGDLLTAASALQHAVTQNILDESFMRGPSELIKAVDDPGRYGERYIREFMSSFVPYSVGSFQMARAMDPYSRQARSIVDAVKNKIPGLSEELLPRRDIWGEPLPNRSALGGAGVTAIYEQRMSHDPVNTELLKLGMAPARVERKIRNVQLTDQEYDDFQRISGRLTKQALDRVVNSPQWQTWPPHVKRDFVQQTFKAQRDTAANQVMRLYRHIPIDAWKQTVQKKLKD